MAVVVASWETGSWGECSTTCNKGYEIRSVYCKQQHDERLHAVVPDALCQGTKPTTIRPCNEDVKCPRWDVGNWSKVGTSACRAFFLTNTE